MDIKKAMQKRKEFEAGIIAKALEDSKFRNELLENPRKVVEREAGKDLPDDLVVKIIEEESATVTIVLPPAPVTKKESGELTTDMLEKIAGGGDVGDDSIFQKGIVL